MSTDKKVVDRARRHNRIRARVEGTATRPRLAVYRSNTVLYAQAIDDVAGKTLFATDTRKLAGATPLDRSVVLGKNIAASAKKAGVEAVVFDRGGFAYAGSIASMADAARESGLKF